MNIYRGQLWFARWCAPALVPAILEFMGHEQKHRAHFAKHLQQRGVRRCRSYHLCGAGGLVLGAITGLMGRTAILATTVAVERVVLRHLDAQMLALKGADAEAHDAVEAILQEERIHHDEAAIGMTPDTLWVRALMTIVAGSTEAVIWLGMRL